MPPKRWDFFHEVSSDFYFSSTQNISWYCSILVATSRNSALKLIANQQGEHTTLSLKSVFIPQLQFVKTLGLCL